LLFFPISFYILRPPPISTLFPYTTLFRSSLAIDISLVTSQRILNFASAIAEAHCKGKLVLAHPSRISENVRLCSALTASQAFFWAVFRQRSWRRRLLPCCRRRIPSTAW